MLQLSFFRPITKGEIGCFMSHYRIWAKVNTIYFNRDQLHGYVFYAEKIVFCVCVLISSLRITKYKIRIPRDLVPGTVFRLLIANII